MKYLLMEAGNEKYWFEIDDGGYAYRQIIVDQFGISHISCMEDCLAEGILVEDELDGNITEIYKDEFENKWNSSISKYSSIWKEIKNKYPIGKILQGKCQYFYPQGVIIKCKDCLGVYKGSQNLQINQDMQARVCRYDEINMWLVIEDLE